MISDQRKQTMRSTVMSVLYAMILTAGVFPASSFALEPNLQAQSRLNGTFEGENPRVTDSGPIVCYNCNTAAEAYDSISFTDESGTDVSGDLRAEVKLGEVKMYQKLLSRGTGAGMIGQLYGKFFDRAAVGFDNKYPAGTINITPKLNSSVGGLGEVYYSQLSYTVMVTNKGTTQAPKDLLYVMKIVEKVDNTGSSYSISGPSSIPVSKSDVLEINGYVYLDCWVQSYDNSMSSIEADYSRTAHLYIDSSTPGFTLTADSGHDYRTPKTGTSDKTALNPGTLMLLLGDKKVKEK